MSDKIVNKDIENLAEKVQSSEEAVEVIKEIEKIIRSYKFCILWLAH